MKTNNVMIDFVNKIVLEDIIYFVESFKRVNRYSTGKTVNEWTLGFEDNIIEGPIGDESGTEKMGIAISPKDLELFLTRMANSKSISNNDIVLVSPEILRFYVLAVKRNTLHITERLSYNGDNLVIDNKFAERCKEYLFNMDKVYQRTDAITEMRNFVNFSVILGKDKNNHYNVRVFSDNLASITTTLPDPDKPVVSFDYDRAFKYFTDIFKDSEELSIFVNNYYKLNYRKSNDNYIYPVNAAAVYNNGVEDYGYFFNKLIEYLFGSILNRYNLKIKTYISYHSSLNPLSDLFSNLLTKADIENTYLINTGAYIKENSGEQVNIWHSFEKKIVFVVDHNDVGYLELFNNSRKFHDNDSKNKVEYYHSRNITIKPYEIMADEVLVGEVADIFNFYDKIKKFIGTSDKDDIFLTRSCNCGIPLYHKSGNAVNNYGSNGYTYHYRLPLENSISIYNKNNKIFNIVFIKPSDTLETINFLGKITIFSGLGLESYNKLKRINADFSDLHIIMNHAFPMLQ